MEPTVRSAADNVDVVIGAAMTPRDCCTCSLTPYGAGCVGSPSSGLGLGRKGRDERPAAALAATSASALVGDINQPIGRIEMNRSTARWVVNTYQCRSCYERVSHVEAGMLCTPCHQIRQLFPTGETNRRRRGHAFITKTMVQKIPPFYATESVELPDKQLYAHYFVGGCDWYVAELDPPSGDAFGYADLGHGEWGYFNLIEMENTVVDGWVVVERDLHFQPQTARELGIG